MTPLFDAYAGFGARKPAQRQAVSAGDLSSEMERLSIERALVRTAPEDLDSDFAASNEALLEACRTRRPFVPCPVVVPNTAGDTAPEGDQVADLLGRGAGAVCLRPKRDHWILSDWVAGPLLEALRARNVPAFCKEDDISLQEAADLARRYPQLPIILAEVGYRSQRVVLPLLQTFGNVFLCLGGAFSVHRGIEQLVAEAGPERVLFGTGFPATDPMAAITQLMYAGISDDQRALIGAGNLARLVEGIRR